MPVKIIKGWNLDAGEGGDWIKQVAKDFKMGDLVRYNGKVYEVGYRNPNGDKMRLQDPETHEGHTIVYAGQDGLEKLPRTARP